MEWFLKVVKENYANFDGRARRKEYWMYTLCVVVINFVIGFVAGFLGFFSEWMGSLVMMLSYLVTLGLLLPSLAVGARRLHDTGKSGWWLLLSPIPFVNFYLIYLLVIEGDRGPNEFGPDPKEEESWFPKTMENSPFIRSNA